MAEPESYKFGAFLLEATERRLSRGGQPIPLPPKALDVLVALLRKAGTLVTKQQLLNLVWPEAFVEEGVLSVHISALRKALGDGERTAGYIETVSRSGYRFVGDVSRHYSERQSSAQVFELCGRGRAHLRAASMYEVRNALAAFRGAIELDASYAPAHAGLALAHCAQAGLRMAPPAEAYLEAKTAALRALAMDPSCADAQVALGAVLLFSEWDWDGAERSLQRALTIDSNHTEAYLLFGQLLEARGKLETGLAMKQKALQREPSSPCVHLALSLSYWNQRCYDQSIEWAKQILALDPAHPLAREHLAGAYLKKGDSDRWLAENLKHAQAHGLPAAALEPLKQAYAKAGRAGVAQLFLERASRQPHAFPALQLAINYAEVGDFELAFQHLERALDERDPGLVHLAVAPQWDRLRGDRRFLHCLARMGLNPVRL